MDIMKLKGMGEDGTCLLCHIIADTQSTASTASCNALNAIMTKENGSQKAGGLSSDE